MPIDYSLN